MIRKTSVIRLGDVNDNKVKPINDYIVADIYDSTEGSKRVKLYMGTGDAPAGEVKFTNQIALSDGNGHTATLVDEDGTEIDPAVTSTDLGNWFGDSGLGSAYAGHKVMFTYWVKATTKKIIVSGDSFPGTYYIQGDTYCRSDVTGKDQFFQFIIPKAKMSSEETITLEAEGDPATFNMNLTVLRPEDGEMMKLVQYDLEAPGA
jgi:hypothetical protein